MLFVSFSLCQRSVAACLRAPLELVSEERNSSDRMVFVMKLISDDKTAACCCNVVS